MSIFTNTSRAIAKAATIALPKLGEYTVRGLATTIIIAEKGVSVAGSFAQNVKDEMDSKKALATAEEQVKEHAIRTRHFELRKLVPWDKDPEFHKWTEVAANQEQWSNAISEAFGNFPELNDEEELEWAYLNIYLPQMEADQC